MWTILIFIAIGMVAGWAASLLIRREKYPTDWGVLFIVGVSGSLIAGIVVNLVLGDGFKIAPGGIIGSIVVACILLWLYTRAQNRQAQRRHVRQSTRADGTRRERKGGKKHHSKR
jgi:uncharacterized membrane protein YeaQ/YmgE (transglycosylase-associated protein family)